MLFHGSKLIASSFLVPKGYTMHRRVEIRDLGYAGVQTNNTITMSQQEFKKGHMYYSEGIGHFSFFDTDGKAYLQWAREWNIQWKARKNVK